MFVKSDWKLEAVKAENTKLKNGHKNYINDMKTIINL